MSTTNKTPAFTAYVVEKKHPDDEKGFWHPVGKAWLHGKGEGLSLVIFPGLSVSGRLELMKPRPKAEEPGSEPE